jgi:MinD-like ATPase involved in chromosome partitioning or flagellar assembly
MSNKLSVIMATGETEINDILISELSSYIEPVGKGLYKQDLLNKLDEKKPHVVIIGDLLAQLEEGLNREEYLKETRRRYPGTRIIYIYDPAQEDLPTFLKFLVQQQIYDFLSSEDLDLGDIINLLQSPREYYMVKKYEEHVDLTRITEEVKVKEKEVYISQKQKTIAFYSPTATGKSTLIQNTAVYLAQADPSVDIALIDADFLKPTLATRMRLNQGNKNSKMYFEELLQRIDGNRLDGEMLKEYMIEHPKYPSLKIFDCEFQKPEYQDLLQNHHIEKIFEILKEEFTIILVDTTQDIEVRGTYICLKKSTALYHVIDYDFSNCLAFQKSRMIFSQIESIQKKKKRLIINKAFDSTKYKPALIQSYFQHKKGEEGYIDDHLDPVPITAVPLLYDLQIDAIQEGKTLVESQGDYEDQFRYAIHDIAASIHPIPSYVEHKKTLWQSCIDSIKTLTGRVLNRG